MTTFHRLTAVNTAALKAAKPPSRPPADHPDPDAPATQGPAATQRSDRTPIVPRSLQDVALVDGPTAAAVGNASISWWCEQVRRGVAPQPVVRQPRFSRWALADVRRFWQEFAARPHQGTAAKVIHKATKASAAAQAGRTARATRKGV